MPLVTARAGRAPRPPREPTRRNPYKGLRPFNEADAVDFFGRRRRSNDSSDACSRTATWRSVPGDRRPERERQVLGRAGRAGAGDPSRRTRRPARSVPRRDAPGGPSDRGAGGGAPADRGRARRRDSTTGCGRARAGSLEAIDLIVPADAEVVLVVDQFEELFTLTANEHETESSSWSPFASRASILRAGSA